MYLDKTIILELCLKLGYNPNAIFVAEFVRAIAENGAKYGINTPQRLAHFIGQCIKESGGFTYFKEQGNIKYLTSKKYFPFYGRGPIQVTWDDMYKKASQFILGNDSGFKNPDLFSTPYMGTLLSLFWWKKSNVNKASDTNDINKVSKKVNAKDTATFADRKKYTLETIELFKKKILNVQFKGANNLVKLSMWDFNNLKASV